LGGGVRTIVRRKAEESNSRQRENLNNIKNPYLVAKNNKNKGKEKNDFIA